MDIKVVGVVGAGVMGCGVAHALAQTGFEVLLLDLSAEVLESAKRQIRNNLRAQRLLRREPAAEGSAQVLGRINLSTDYRALSESDFVIENVTEKIGIKEGVYRQLDAICPPRCIFAANTSAIPITRIGSLTTRPAQVLGMHFMNPVPLKPMVEVIGGYHTSAETLETAKALLRGMGKEWIVVNDSPGFVSNRVLMLSINEAVFLLEEHVASAEQVDDIFKSCFGHKMGPLETADLIGLDTILYSIEVLYESFGDSKYRPCPLLRKMVNAGLFGRKSGRGFYTY